MHLDIASRLETTEDTHRVAGSHFEIYWEGLLFAPGTRPGLPSAEVLLETLRPSASPFEAAKCTHPLRGSWTAFIHSLQDGYWVACANHSHHRYLYYSEGAVSSSFLRLREDVSDKSALCPESVAALLCTGYCIGPTAFYEGLKLLDSSCYVCINNGQLTVESKQLPDMFERLRRPAAFVDTVDHLFSSLRGERLCLDLTGGTDSRCLAKCLDYLGYDFDLAVEGDDDYSEVRIARTVAALLGRTIRQGRLASADFDPSDPRSAWLASDGLDLPILSYKFETWRRQFGYSVVVSGVAGELYKDGGWYRAALASFVCGNRITGLVDRIVKSGHLLTWDGLKYEDLFSMLTPAMGERVRDWVVGVRRRLLTEFGGDPVMEAGDRIFLDFSINRPAGTRLRGMPRYAPLLEPDLVGIGVNQPLLQRLNHRLYRREVGRLDERVALVPTDRGGLNMSARLRDQPGEWWKYCRYALSERGIARTRELESENRNAVAVNEFMLGTDDLKSALCALKERMVIEPDFERPSNAQAKRLLMLHYLLGTGAMS